VDQVVTLTDWIVTADGIRGSARGDGAPPTAWDPRTRTATRADGRVFYLDTRPSNALKGLAERSKAVLAALPRGQHTRGDRRISRDER